MRLVNINTGYYFGLLMSFVYLALGAYFFIKYHDSTILKIGSLSVSYGSPNTGYLIYGIAFTGLGLFLLISSWTFYSNLKSDLIEYFELCPFCKGLTTAKLEKDGLFSKKIVIWCRDCRAKWEGKYSSISGHLNSVKLKVPCEDGRGEELLNKELDIDEFMYKIKNKGNHG
jgi:hypothetical protein